MWSPHQGHWERNSNRACGLLRPGAPAVVSDGVSVVPYPTYPEQRFADPPWLHHTWCCGFLPCRPSRTSLRRPVTSIGVHKGQPGNQRTDRQRRGRSSPMSRSRSLSPKCRRSLPSVINLVGLPRWPARTPSSRRCVRSSQRAPPQTPAKPGYPRQFNGWGAGRPPKPSIRRPHSRIAG